MCVCVRVFSRALPQGRKGKAAAPPTAAPRNRSGNDGDQRANVSRRRRSNAVNYVATARRVLPPGREAISADGATYSRHQEGVGRADDVVTTRARPLSPFPLHSFLRCLLRASLSAPLGLIETRTLVSTCRGRRALRKSQKVPLTPRGGATGKVSSSDSPSWCLRGS